MNKIRSYFGCEKNKAIYKSLFGLCSATLMILVLAIAYFGESMGWFSQSKSVFATGIGVTADGFDISVAYSYSIDDGTTYTDVDSWDEIPLDLVPNKAVYIKAVYTSHESEVYTGKTYFVPVEEVPYTETDASGHTKYYYLGSQLFLSSLKIDGTAQTISTDANSYLVPYTLGDAAATAPLLCFDHEATAPNTPICDSFTIPANGTVTLEFSLQFINLPENQNNYKYQNFSTSGRCSRYIYTEFQ